MIKHALLTFDPGGIAVNRLVILIYPKVSRSNRLEGFFFALLVSFYT